MYSIHVELYLLLNYPINDPGLVIWLIIDAGKILSRTHFWTLRTVEVWDRTRWTGGRHNLGWRSCNIWCDAGKCFSITATYVCIMTQRRKSPRQEGSVRSWLEWNGSQLLHRSLFLCKGAPWESQKGQSQKGQNQNLVLSLWFVQPCKSWSILSKHNGL